MAATRDPDGRLVPIHEHTFNGPPRIVLRFAELDGRPTCVNVEIGSSFQDPDEKCPTPVTTSVLRSIPLARLIEQSLWQVVESLRFVKDRGGDVEPFDSQAYNSEGRSVALWVATTDHLVARKASMSAAELGSKRPGRPPLYDDAHYHTVARVYREHSGGRSPTKAVAEHFKTSKSTAAKWVAKTREKGLLERLSDTTAD